MKRLLTCLPFLAAPWLASPWLAAADAPRTSAHLHYTFAAPSGEDADARALVLSAEELSPVEAAFTGIKGNARNGAFTLRPISRVVSTDKETPTEGLRITADKSGRQWNLARCASESSCLPLGAVQVGKSTELALGGSRWRLEAAAPLFPVTGRADSVFLPSWSMDLRARWRDGAFRGAPQRAIVLRRKHDFLFLDAESGRPWLEWKTGSVDIGRFQSAAWGEGSVLTLAGDRAALLVDFARDTVSVVGLGAIDRARGGVSGFAHADLERVWSTPADAPVPTSLLAAAPGLVAWNNGLAAHSPGLNGGLSPGLRVDFHPVPEGVLAARAGANGNGAWMRVLEQAPKGVRLIRYSNAGGALVRAETTEFPVSRRDARSYVLLESSVLQRTTGGAYLLTEKGEVPSSLTGHAGALVSDGHHGVLLRVDDGTRCRWRQFIQHATVAASFLETGYEWPCAKDKDAAPALSGTSGETFALEKVGATWRMRGLRRGVP